MTITFVELHSW